MRTISAAARRHFGAIRLAHILSRRTQTTVRIFTFFLSVVLAALALAAPYTPLQPYGNTFFGSALISGSLWLLSMMLYTYHNSRYFYGLASIIQLSDEVETGVTYEVGELVFTNSSDLTDAFLGHPLGREVLLRSGVEQPALEQFLTSERPRITADMVPLPTDRMLTMIDIGKLLYQQDPQLQQLLATAGVHHELYIGALNWVIGRSLSAKQSQRWWSKDHLSRIPGLGRSWAYGRAYRLERYLRSINTTAVFSAIAGNSAYAAEKVTTIEGILARDKAANVLIVGEPGVGKMDLVAALARRLAQGVTLNALSNKQVVVLDSDRLFASHEDKQSFELAFLTMLAEATHAGNLILVIENISTFIREAQALNVEVAALLDPYLANPALHLIATDTPGSYHSQLETLGAFTRRFAEVLIEPADLSSTINVLLGVTLAQEHKHHVLFTYGAVVAIAEAADRYLVDGVMPDKAVTLLVEVAASAGQAGNAVITSDEVYTHISQKTGIPAGPIDAGEREQLTNLEERLHERVIGQDQAISAIARTMRRARAGIHNSERPIGSFLFLGPTGVGKTETAKALAFTFFGGEDKLQRLDMSEFSGEDAIYRLLGTAEQSGVLADLLREHPYSVVLLDEFEKAGREVHDLFLQILDEGRFTDGRGQTINARNAIFIATSNAGSDLILKTVAQRRALATLEQALINHIIEQGIYRPELINRFDSTIIFEPLSREEQGQVAGLLLTDLYKRIKERGYELTISRDLMDVLVEKGYDPQFGARPMQRVIQDLIEEKVAQKIIMGEVQKGGTIALSKADFADAELTV